MGKYDLSKYMEVKKEIKTEIKTEVKTEVKQELNDSGSVYSQENSNTSIGFRGELNDSFHSSDYTTDEEYDEKKIITGVIFCTVFS